MTTALGIITSSMRKIGALTKGEVPDADEASDAIDVLNDYLASISNDSLVLYARTLENFTLSGGTSSYTIGSGGTFNTARPIKIISGYTRSGTIDTNLDVNTTDEEYAAISIKSTQGTPQFLNYTNGFPLATIRLYPTPDAADTLYILTEKELSSFSLNDTVSLPPGWKRMLINNLAVELAPEYGQSVPADVLEIARESKAEIRRAVMAAKSMRYSDVSGEENIYSGWYS